ncbi:MAG: YkgJ family cysteine cluster protein [Proteobacteria bacterium]|nr:MAG: YkgJ family cysteine cluster protein [Pseudomonadota bacterium]
MITDKDRPSTWIAYRASLCASCVAACCTMPLEVKREDLERLGLADPSEVSNKKVMKRLQKEGVVRTYRASTELFLLEQKSDGSCQFLGADRRCTVYETRPSTCRGFPADLGPRVGFCPYKQKILPTPARR